MGEGYITRDVATTYDAEIDGFDISDNALVTARAKSAHDRISYFQLNLNDYVPDRKYDLIMCEETLCYLTDDELTSAVRMFHRAIKSGGYFKITSMIIGEVRYRKYFTIDSMRELLVNNGFEVVFILPSVIQKKGYVEKAFYRLLEYMNNVKLVNSNLLEYLTEQTLRRRLDRCYAVSLLARKA